MFIHKNPGLHKKFFEYFENQPKIRGEIWFNSKPLMPLDMDGKVLLIDFWTYTCVNCLRTIPYLKEWWQKYRKFNFLQIGIHTPEFEFEKDSENVERAIKELGITWPVVLDNDYANWNNFANKFWPAKYLVDQTGKIVYKHFGEGNYHETEEVIQELLRENLGKIKLPPTKTSQHFHGGVCFIPTPEVYLGYERGFLSNDLSYQPEEEFLYRPPRKLKEDSVVLSGKFRAKRQYVESDEKGAEILLKFRATEVNAVLAAEGMATVEIVQNGVKEESNIRGANVGKNGIVIINEPKMFNLLKSRDLREGILTIRLKDGKFRAYSFTFSGCSNGEV